MRAGPTPDIGPAVVVPCADGGADHKARRRFIDESRLAASLDHPNTAPIYEAGGEDEQLFLAMRSCRARTATARSEGPAN